ncbi:MAG TPA: M23 family metallopeptidase [Steroidobacteraceae bacterium]|nr:M23 family metallopeptidase [Steroidobacteraceae bacterium]
MRRLLIASAALVLLPIAHADTDTTNRTRCFSAAVCVTVVRTQSILDFDYELLTDQPYTVAVTSTQRGLGAINHSLHFKTSQMPRAGKLFSYQIPAQGRWNYEWHIAIHVGEQTVQHESTAVYRLPFASGSSVRIIQAYDDPRSHTGSQRYAVDFSAPIGTEVRAARAGVVVGADGTSNESSSDGVENARANYVWVRHSDGTIGYYLHLRQRGVAVTTGQAVKAGQLLGYSGCTGRCTGPHLHFHVSTPLQARDDVKFEAYKTFPAVFATANGVEFVEAGRSYVVP